MVKTIMAALTWKIQVYLFFGSICAAHFAVDIIVFGGEIVVTHPNVGDFSEEKNKCMMSSEV